LDLAVALINKMRGKDIHDPLITPLDTRLHVVNKQGYVETSPADLALASGYPLEIYAMASCMQSEENSDKGRLAVGLAIWNAAKKNKANVARLLLHSNNPVSTGHFGDQADRYAATVKPPTSRTLLLAKAIQAGQVPDIAEGAKQWDSPKAQDHNHELFLKYPKKFPAFRLSSAEIEAKRISEGRRVVRIPGVPETRFWA
jgi:hypothetical protein